MAAEGDNVERYEEGLEAERHLDPVDHDAADRDDHDRNGRVAADRDHRGQDNFNTLANLMSQRVIVQDEANKIFRDQMSFQNEEIASLREDQLAEQRQINDVDNRVNVVERGQVEDREQIAAINEDFLALRGEFDDIHHNRDDRNQGNINTLANLMSQQISAQQETNDVQKETNEIFRDQIRVHNEQLISLREDQLAEQRQINDVGNRVNVVERGQVEDREQIAAIKEGFLALRGEFDDMVEKLKRADGTK